MKFFQLLAVTAVLIFSAAASATGQTGVVRGNVFEKGSGAPLAFATVQIVGTSIGATTDEEGFFSLAGVPVGRQKLIGSYTGFISQEVEIEIKKGQILYQKLFFEEQTTETGAVTITAQREIARTEIQISKVTVTPKEIKALPSTGGQADIAQYLTVLPGVIFTGDQGGQLYIRGGSPVQNRIMIDGMTIYNPFHSIGFFSVFETETIRNVDVLTGGFSAEHGGRVSAILDLKTREGNRKRFGGHISASPFQVKALAEGPIVKLKTDDGSSVSFMLTGKKSLIDRTGKTLYPNVENPEGIPFEHQDIYGKVSFMAPNGSRMNLFGFNYSDDVNYQVADFAWDAAGGGANFTLVPQNSNTIVGGSLAASNYKSRFAQPESDGSIKPRTSGISSYSGILDFTNFGRNSEVKYGIELNGFTTDFEFINYRGLRISQNQNTTELAGFVKVRKKIGPLVIEPSFRAQYYASLFEFSPEPRLGMKYNVSDRFRLKAAGGLYSQNLVSTVNERDVVNLFVGFLAGPEETIYKPNQVFQNEVNSRLQRSQHVAAGFEYDVTDRIDVNIEGYYKNFSQLIALNRFKAEDALQGRKLPDFITETGYARGIDFTAKGNYPRFYVWATYSLGFVRRDDGEQIYYPVFDRRHNANFLLTYQAGKKKDWEIGARWNLGSGFPFTLTQGFYTQFDFFNGIQTDVLQGNPDLGIIYDEVRNAGRLPYYHRLDVSVKKSIEFSKSNKLELTASATNAYDRQNIFFFDRVKYERVNQLPILPSLAATWSF